MSPLVQPKQMKGGGPVSKEVLENRVSYLLEVAL